MVLTDYEKEALSRISREKSWEHAKWFAESGQKLSGTPENERAVEYLLNVLKGYHVQAKAVEYQSWLDFPKLTEAELRVMAPKKMDINAMPLAQMASTGPEGIEGKLVYVAGGGLEDYKDKNVKDKIVLARARGRMHSRSREGSIKS